MDNQDFAMSENERQMFAFLSAPVIWRTPPRRRPSHDIDNNSEEQLVSDHLDVLPCGSSIPLRKSSIDSCDFEYDLLVNPYMARALDVIKFHIVYDLESEELEDITKPFIPTMAHQIFGNDEVITGYRNLSINFTILPNSFQTMMEYSYASVRRNILRGEIPDEIDEKFQDWFPHLVKIDEFEKLRKNEDLMKMHGEILLTFPVTDRHNLCSNVYITKCDQNNSDFLNFHKRFQALIVFYIDAASIIDYSDTNWQFYYVYKDILKKGEVVSKLPIGFCTVYKFTLSKRARVSQFFILPNFQQRGIGSRLLGIIYKELRKQKEFKFITVECPCHEFSMLRDKLDLRFIIKLPQFSKENVLQGFKMEMALIAQKKWKLTSDQVKHLVTVLRLYHVQTDSELYNSFVRDLKQDCYNNYKKKLMRIASKGAKEERIARLKRIVDDDCLLNRTIHRDVTTYIKRMHSHKKYIEKLLS